MTLEQRQQIIDLKQQNHSLKYIEQVTGIKRKTIQSVVKLYRKKIYSQFENQVINDYLEDFLNLEILKTMKDKQQRNHIRNIIEKEFVYETSSYKQHLANRKESQRKRILNKVVWEIQFRYHQHQNQKFATQVVNDESEIHFQTQESFSVQLFDEYDWFM